MSKDVNRVELEGCLGVAPVIRVAPVTQKVMAQAPLYTNYSVRNGNDWETRSERHNLVFFDENAEKAKGLLQGTRLHIVGRLRTRKYQDRDTKLDKYITEVVVSSVQLVFRTVNSNQDDVQQPSAANG
jgi:single-strand DNA-binding protein